MKIKDAKQIGEFIKQRINQLNMKQIELAEQLAKEKGETYDKNTLRDLVSKWINGSRTPGIEYIYHLSKVLKVSIEEILVAGEVCEKYENRPYTLYAIAKSNNFEQLDYIMNLKNPDHSIVGDNYDEYDKTILDYAVEFENIEMIKYMLEKEYIYFPYPYIQISTRINIGGQCTYPEMQNKIINLAIKYDDLELFEKIVKKNIPIWREKLYVEDVFANDSYREGFCFTNEMIEKIFSTTKIFDYLTTPYVADLETWCKKINKGIFFLSESDYKSIQNEKLSQIERLPECFNLLFDYALCSKQSQKDKLIEIAINHKKQAIKKIQEFYPNGDLEIDPYGNIKTDKMDMGSLSMVGAVNAKTYSSLNEIDKNKVNYLLV